MGYLIRYILITPTSTPMACLVPCSDFPLVLCVHLPWPARDPSCHPLLPRRHTYLQALAQEFPGQQAWRLQPGTGQAEGL
jgi:hypothetical protein